MIVPVSRVPSCASARGTVALPVGLAASADAATASVIAITTFESTERDHELGEPVQDASGARPDERGDASGLRASST